MVLPDALDVFDGFSVAECELLPVVVFDDVIVDVPVNVFRAVTVDLIDEETVVDAVPDRDGGLLLDTVGDPDEVLEDFAENDMVGLDEVVFDVETEAVVVRLSFIVRVVVDVDVPVCVNLDVMEFVVDPVIDFDDIDVFVDVLVIYDVNDARLEKKGAFVGSGEYERIEDRVEVFVLIGDNVAIIGSLINTRG